MVQFHLSRIITPLLQRGFEHLRADSAKNSIIKRSAGKHSIAKKLFTSSFTIKCVLTVIITGTQIIAPAYAASKNDPAVDVIVVQPQALRTWSAFSGRLVAVDNAAIKPLVSGTIQHVLFKEGQQVKKGQPLFIIDPRPQQAAAAQAQAQLASATAKYTLSADELKRAQQLLNSKLIAQSVFDAALSANQVAAAEMQKAQASLTQATLDVEYAHINAPFSGRISRAELTEGNVVQAGADAPVLTQIIANEKFYADFNVDEATYIRIIRNSKQQNTMPVELTLAGDSNTVYQGHISSFDNHIDSTSGTIRARALFENSDGALTAGMFADIRLGSSDTTSTLLIPERAVGTNQSKKFVLVIDEKNIANYREIILGERYNNQRIVISGISAGEKIVVNGLSHVKPNAPVNPTVQSAEQAAKLVSN